MNAHDAQGKQCAWLPGSGLQLCLSSPETFKITLSSGLGYSVVGYLPSTLVPTPSTTNKLLRSGSPRLPQPQLGFFFFPLRGSLQAGSHGARLEMFLIVDRVCVRNETLALDLDFRLFSTLSRKLSLEVPQAFSVSNPRPAAISQAVLQDGLPWPHP